MNLIFLCPAKRKAVGGVKVIYLAAQLCQEILGNSGCAQVLHPNRPWFKPRWTELHAKTKRAWFKWRWDGKPSWTGIGRVFNPANDVVVIPEVWVRKYARQLYDANIPYVIFVQNGYWVTKGDRNSITQSYQNAHAIWSVSEDTTRCIVEGFGCKPSRIQLVHPAVGEAFQPAHEKAKVISYMPRKLGQHAALVRHFTENKLSPEWVWDRIENVPESEVARRLGRSSLFLSFSELEGLGLPPIEAALCGNRVIGYTGQGGNTYWSSPVFTRIECGDILGFADAIVAATQVRESESLHADWTQTLNHLRQTYSQQTLQRDLTAALDDLHVRR